MDRFITVAIHTYEKAIALRALLEREGIEVQFRNVNIEQPVVSSGIRVRIKENDLPLALRIIENREIFSVPIGAVPGQANPSMPVLVPVDFSDNSFDATITAFKVASQHGTSITLLHTYIDPYIAGNMQLSDSWNYELSDITSREQALKTAQAQMRHFIGRLHDMIKSGELPPVKIDSCVSEGVPEDAIDEYTKANNPFIIVMATRCAKKKESELIGSVTAEVLDKCRFSLLALPEPPVCGHMKFPPQNILFFSNMEQEDILAIDTLYRLFPKAAATVTIASLPNKKRQLMRYPTEAAKALKDYCTQNFKNYKFEVDNLGLDNLQEEMEQLEQDRKFDMVVVPNKKKNVFSRLFSPSLAHRVLFSADVPMLVIPI